jgi:hypothetical protein
MKRMFLTAPALLLGLTMAAHAQVDVVPNGTSITVRTNERIDLHDSSDGRIYSAVIDQDVRDRDGHVAVPRGSSAELIVRNLGRNDLAVDMESVTVQGRRYIVSTTDQPMQGSDKDGIGQNSRTGKYVGGGALLGTIIGAIAGGGKGAAIGALAGGAAGAGTQVITRGRDVRIPSESLLTFRLDRRLEVGRGNYSRDNGFDRNGVHYHND